MTTLHRLQNQLLALVYKLSWGVKRPVHLADSYLGLTRHPHDDASSDSSSDVALEADLGTANSKTDEDQSLHQQVYNEYVIHVGNKKHFFLQYICIMQLCILHFMMQASKWFACSYVFS